MLQSTRSQKVECDLATEQQQRRKGGDKRERQTERDIVPFL